jgi:hypothetical protein
MDLNPENAEFLKSTEPRNNETASRRFEVDIVKANPPAIRYLKLQEILAEFEPESTGSAR